MLPTIACAAGVSLLLTSMFAVIFCARPAAAEEVVVAHDLVTSQDLVLPSPYLFTETVGGPVELHGVTRALAPGWTASYGIGLADETALSWSYLRYDSTLSYGASGDAASRDNWRHFLGVEYAPVEGMTLLGGIAKAGGMTGNKGAGLSPTGYERLRLSTGARWRGESWGIDGTFSFIPTGATRVPGDAGFLPGMGNSEATYLFSLTISRRF